MKHFPRTALWMVGLALATGLMLHGVHASAYYPPWLA